ncbi:cytoskeletal protein CcmA (bactofilin family) [Winogradskyella wandonensis]|uniref:Cytoskeletal protein CcmA (Bactofilin family) n=1 Tax=Winogradskyella wandonensis TaxID=1442586 RepID=A0A4R1KRU8_9FLAO|nr:polymer-forming cytoskeletal protein [Winogradskyella wandonensis]TCK67775.1 cytoskeletal protein CcmA (bactofilin family) [Winogradskyella wandonensis]
MRSNKKQKTTMESTSQQNIIAHGTKIVGDIESKGPFRIDGTVEGTVKTDGKVVIGKAGSIVGTLEAVNVDIEGKFSGKLSLKGTLSLKSSAQIDGEVQVNKLAVEPGATFNATCSMGAVKTLASDAGEGKNQKGQSA